MDLFFLWLHYFWLGSFIIWLLLQMANINWWILFFRIPSPHSSFISWHIVWDYLHPLFKQLSDNHQFKAELLKYSLKCFWFPDQLYSLRKAVTLMKLSSDPYHRQKLKKQPGAWTPTIPGESLGYEIAVFMTHLSQRRLHWGPCNPNVNMKMSRASGGPCTKLVLKSLALQGAVPALLLLVKDFHGISKI